MANRGDQSQILIADSFSCPISADVSPQVEPPSPGRPTIVDETPSPFSAAITGNCPWDLEAEEERETRSDDWEDGATIGSPLFTIPHSGSEKKTNTLTP